MGSVYLAYRELAEHFEASEQEPPAIEYYRKCLEIARDANHRGLQLEVGSQRQSPKRYPSFSLIACL